MAPGVRIMAKPDVGSIARALSACLIGVLLLTNQEHYLSLYLINSAFRLDGQAVPVYRHWYGPPEMLVIALVVIPFLLGTLSAAISRFGRWALLGAVAIWAAGIIVVIVFRVIAAHRWLPACLVVLCAGAMFASGMVGIRLFERLPGSHWWRRNASPWLTGMLVIVAAAALDETWYLSVHPSGIGPVTTMAHESLEHALLVWGPFVSAGLVVGLVWGKRGVIPVSASVPAVLFGVLAGPTGVALDNTSWEALWAVLVTAGFALAAALIRGVVLPSKPRRPGTENDGQVVHFG